MKQILTLFADKSHPEMLSLSRVLLALWFIFTLFLVGVAAVASVWTGAIPGGFEQIFNFALILHGVLIGGYAAGKGLGKPNGGTPGGKD